MKPSNDRIPPEEFAIANRMAALGERNARFASMTPAEQRVEIAKDVLEWVKLRKLRARSGTYLEPVRGQVRRDGYEEDNYDSSAVAELEAGDVHCNVCALGAVFMAAAYCGIVPKADTGSTDMRQMLAPYFEIRQLHMIESAFEQTAYESEDVSCENAADFGQNYGTDTGRLNAIMRNIIKHDGTFTP